MQASEASVGIRLVSDSGKGCHRIHSFGRGLLRTVLTNGEIESRIVIFTRYEERRFLL